MSPLDDNKREGDEEFSVCLSDMMSGGVTLVQGAETLRVTIEDNEGNTMYTYDSKNFQIKFAIVIAEPSSTDQVGCLHTHKHTIIMHMKASFIMVKVVI